MPKSHASTPWLMKHSALSYANQWFMTDRKFMKELRKNGSQEIDARVLGTLAAKYMVARGFKTERGDPLSSSQRWGTAAVHLTAAVQSPEQAEVKVDTLAIELGKIAPVKRVPSKLLSAATKFLWFAGEHDVRILDKRAVDALGRFRGARGTLGANYKQYATVWKEQFDAHEKVLEEALFDLPRQLVWTCIPSDVHAEAKAVFKELWFADRIFDKYLWTLGVGVDGGATSFV
ncbi:hypothetical protein L1889_06600 [Paenalcaligenes niemegkensis]|uniref:8-oxoguanine DNA glycosylase OGG fold protein n=1 Tax=Paenalcaligenes niemegkensis TaxID=2895469 RepID=UPI001EE8A4D0|nr:hypothetical protein [Paenalcaligenes niemegkensis]MCQ9616415.1 hypothetical protein [Paenalcaligenes niemegkensis]